MQAFVTQFIRPSTHIHRSCSPLPLICTRRPRASAFTLRAMATQQATPAVAQQRLQSDTPPKYLDVRTATEFAAGHVPGAVNVPVTLDFANPVPTFADDVKKVFAVDADLLVGCKSGARSKMAIAILEKEGFQKLTNVDGGFNAWSSADLPVEK